jgi:hypothetical protein
MLQSLQDAETAEERMTDQAAVDWPTCDEDGCIGVRLAATTECLAHARDEQRYAALEQLGETGEIDASGVPISRMLVGQILDAAPHDADNRPTFRAIQFVRAIFQGGAPFTDAIFQGDVRFNSATFQDYAGFTGAIFQGDARFEEATFQGSAGFNGATFRAAPYLFTRTSRMSPGSTWRPSGATLGSAGRSSRATPSSDWRPSSRHGSLVRSWPTEVCS